MIVDSRETNVIPSLLRAVGVEFEQAEMDAGDYRIGKDILIERKAARSDLGVSITDSRLFCQLGALCGAPFCTQ